MARITDTILSNQAYAIGTNPPIVDLKMGGQTSLVMEHREVVSSAPYVKRNMRAILIDCPRIFDFLPNPEKWRQTLQALVERHAIKIDGMNSQVSWEFAEHDFGGAGEKIHGVKNATRAVPAPVFTYQEKYGRPISRFIEDWGIYALMDPNTKIPNIMTIPGIIGQLTDLLPDMVGMTVLFFEPDATSTKVDKAWLSTNMMPKQSAPVEGSFDVNNPGDMLEFSVEYTSTTQVGAGVVQFAQRILDDMNLTGANPMVRPAFVDAISANVQAAATGVRDALQTAAAEAVQI